MKLVYQEERKYAFRQMEFIIKVEEEEEVKGKREGEGRREKEEGEGDGEREEYICFFFKLVMC